MLLFPSRRGWNIRISLRLWYSLPLSYIFLTSLPYTVLSYLRTATNQQSDIWIMVISECRVQSVGGYHGILGARLSPPPTPTDTGPLDCTYNDYILKHLRHLSLIRPRSVLSHLQTLPLSQAVPYQATQ